MKNYEFFKAKFDAIKDILCSQESTKREPTEKEIEDFVRHINIKDQFERECG